MGDPVPYFDSTLEIPVDKIPNAPASTSRNYVTAIVKMHWMFNEGNGITKYSFTAGNNLQFEVDFTGDIRLRLSDTVLLCLKGAQLKPRPTLKPPKLPFKLAFPDGVMLKAGERIIDTFQEAPPSPVVPSWFASQPPREPSPSPPRTPSEPEGTPSPPKRGPEKQLQSPPQAEPERVPLFVRETQDVEPNIASPSRNSTPATGRNPPRTVIREGPVNENQLPKKRPRSNTPEPLPNQLQHNMGSGSGSSRVSELVQVEAPATEDASAPQPKKKRRRKGGKSNANQSAAEPSRNPALDMNAGFHSQLIGTFPPLGDLEHKPGGKVAVVAVVRGISVPRLSRNGDWTTTIELLDPSNTEQPFVVTIFLPDSLKDCIPSVKAGDVIILLKITLVVFQGRLRATGYGDSFQWAGYSPSEKRHFHSAHRTFLDEEHCPFFTPTQDELQYAGQLAEWWKATQEVAKSKEGGNDTLMSGPRGRQLITLAEAQPNIFFKSVVEILLKFPPTDQLAEFLITDYTVHPQFLPREPRAEDKAEKQDQTKVYGKRVLKMTLWGNVQLEHAQEIEPGFYYIDNLRVKFDSKGYLEGTLQDDRRKIDKLRKDDPMLEDLLKRKEKYFSEPASPTLGASKVPRRDFNLHSAGDLLPAPAVPPQRQVQPKKQGPALTRLLYENVVQTPMQKLLGHASCPEIFRIRARIIAFEPYSLKRFTCGYCTNCNTDLLPDSKACHACDDIDMEYVVHEYRIRLCVEEESDNPTPGSQDHRLSMVVDLAGKDAETFFSGIPPSDLHDARNARALRSRLAPILGNLEVYQNDLATGDSGKALEYGQYFDMLIQSYKTAVKGENSLGNKRYKIWGTELLPKASK